MNLRVLPLALLAVFCLAGAASTTAFAEDEKCVEKCDEGADVCMSDAGDDEKKQKACDEEFEACTSKCG
jgi:hypothetical protein